MAVVALSWILATILGALPYLFSGTHREAGKPMSWADAMFEAQSGFSTTGASVFGDVENITNIPRCILFWRATTHYLGGLGIMVLFVAILGSSGAGKVFMKLEMTGKGTGPQKSIQKTAMILFWIYTGLCVVLALVLWCLGLTPFDAICHAFSVIATGGFSNFNASAGHFVTHGYRFAAAIEWTLILFMFLASCNFILLYTVLRGGLRHCLRDTEFLAFLGIVLFAATSIFAVGSINKDFDAHGTAEVPIAGVPIAPGENDGIAPPALSLRLATFQVVSIISTTGLCTDDYQEWNSYSYGIILVLMFLGGCAGSTAGGIKVIRYVIAWKTIRMEVERCFRPNVVRSLFVNAGAVERDAIYNVLVYFVTVFVIAVSGTLLVLLLEPNTTWDGMDPLRKLLDSFSAVASTMNNVGPGFGVIGAKGNYGAFTDASKLLFTWLMMLGRLEVFVVLALFHPGFWKKHG